jgi:hypothetical protein
MICPSCNEHNHDDVKFCRQCGARMERRNCANGHTIPDGLSECPYCPRKTVASAAPAQPQPPAAKGTVLVSHTELQQSGVEPQAGPGPAPASAPPPDPRRAGTVVVLPEGDDAAPATAPAAVAMGGAVAQSGASPLAGFIVSFSVDRNGVFWPLRYGRTRIGSGPDNDVQLSHPQISGSHAMVLVRAKQGEPKVWCEDCGSSNGTLLNGQDIFNSRPDLSSGDVLQVGPIELKLLVL